MATITLGHFPARPGADRNAFLVFTALVWVGVLSGFGTDSFDHLSRHGLDYPLIVHFHAVVFVGWLALFTTQVALIRSSRADIHRRLGVAGAALVAVMVVLGPWTALVMDAAAFKARGAPPVFLAVQLVGMVAFAGLTGAGLLLRGIPSAHKRLLMLGLIEISSAGFSRFLNDFIAAPFGHTALSRMVDLYGGSDLLILGLGAYDLITRGKLHPAYMAGAAWAVGLQFVALALLPNPAWKVLSLHLIGH